MRRLEVRVVDEGGGLNYDSLAQAYISQYSACIQMLTLNSPEGWK